MAMLYRKPHYNEGRYNEVVLYLYNIASVLSRNIWKGNIFRDCMIYAVKV